MDLSLALSKIAGVRPLAELPSAWIWSPAPGINFAAIVDRGAEHIFRLNARGPFDEDLARVILGFARERCEDAGSDSHPLYPLHGFSYPGTAFDSVGVAAPPVHGYHEHEYSEFHDIAYAVFPAYRYEFSDDESEAEARARFTRMLHPANLQRPPVPYLKMRYENTKTRGGSAGPARGYTTEKVLMRELALLDGAPGSFVEFENYVNSVWRVEWMTGVWRATGYSDLNFSEVDSLREWAQRMLVD